MTRPARRACPLCRLNPCACHYDQEPDKAWWWPWAVAFLLALAAALALVIQTPTP